MNESFESKVEKLKSHILDLAKEKVVFIAFSGGTDSVTLLKFCVDILGPKKVVAVFASGIMNSKKTLVASKKIAKKFAVHFQAISHDIFSLPDFSNNTKLRCYACKKNMFTQILNYAKQFLKKSLYSLKNDSQLFEYKSFVIFDGSNTSDFSSNIFRPGQKVLTELDIKSPFLICNFSKTDVLYLAKKLHIENFCKASNSCYATRFSYETKLLPKYFKMIEKAEKHILKFIKNKEKQITENEIQIRCRIHDLKIAKIEVSKDFVHHFSNENFNNTKLYKKLFDILSPMGVKYIAIEKNGFISGSMDNKF